MRTRIIKIGNSQGVRIPKPLLDQTGLRDDVEIQVENDRIILRPVSSPRTGWDEAFAAMAEAGHDALIDEAETLEHTWDEEEWQW